MSDVLAHPTTTMQTGDPGRNGLLPCAEAAALLEIPPAALTTWSERLAFPADVGIPGAPCFRRCDIEALRDALPEAHSVTGAVAAARTRIAALAQPQL